MDNSKLDIAVGYSAHSKTWKNVKMTWAAFAEKLAKSVTTGETFKEYLAANKADQLKIKDVGGYVGGYLTGGRRKPENVMHRQVITLDIDFAHLDFWSDFQLLFDNAAVLHSSHKHHPDEPRFRLVLPLDREVTPEEYSAISRKIAGMLGIEYFDNTTFETNRLMFWPSNPKDVDYYFKQQEGDFISADEILATYTDWKDSSAWPTSPGQLNAVKIALSKQEDPTEKNNLIGIFCRTYTIHEAIEKFLSDEYTHVDGDRYTYKKGSTSSGLIVYENKYAYSHHGTDPSGGKLCNAWDLVRIHLYGDLDTDTKETAPSKLPSFKAMAKYISEDKEVKRVTASERKASAAEDFAAMDFDVETEPVAKKKKKKKAKGSDEIEEDPNEWAENLDIDRKGDYEKSAKNICIVLANDPNVKGIFRRNNFDRKDYICRSTPWRKIKDQETVRDVDMSGIRVYLEGAYGIDRPNKIKDCLNLEFERNSYHPIRDYLSNLVWDGKKRIDQLLVKYMGVEDSLYAREVISKTMIAAVKRVFEPGCKFDNALILVGKEGNGKSTFLKKLAKDWFSDSFSTVEGKSAFEQLQGAWIIEMAELSVLKKAEVEAVKQFISKSEDNYRAAYAGAPEFTKRQNIFTGTTNVHNFLRGNDGHRRFWPVETRTEHIQESIHDVTPEEVDSFWAEAYARYQADESILLSPEASISAKQEQRRHSETDERAGVIEEFVEKLLPPDWSELDIFERRNFLSDPLSKKGKHVRNFVCVAEVWTECLEKPKQDMTRYNTREVNEVLKSLEGWEFVNSTKHFPLYGRQKYFARKLDF